MRYEQENYHHRTARPRCNGGAGTIQGKVIGFGESLYQQLDAALASKKTEGRLST